MAVLNSASVVKKYGYKGLGDASQGNKVIVIQKKKKKVVVRSP